MRFTTEELNDVIEKCLPSDFRDNKTMGFAKWLGQVINNSFDIDFAANVADEFFNKIDDKLERHGAITFELKDYCGKPLFRRVLVAPDQEKILDTFREMAEATPDIVPSIGIMSDSECIVFQSGYTVYTFRVLGGIQ